MVVSSPQRVAESAQSSRSEQLFAQLEESGIAGRAAAVVVHRAVIAAHWARSRRRCVLLKRELAGRLPYSPPPDGVTIAPFDGLSDEPLAGLWTGTEAARMRAHLRRRMDAGIICLAAWEEDRIVAYNLLGPTGAEDVGTAPGTCFGLDLYERRSARGRGVGLALLAASLSYTRDLGFARQATIAPERDLSLIVAATQQLGFTVAGRAERLEMLGRVSWSWPLHGSICCGPRLIV
jgi:GNAT superfamily N-acetyltransferase